ncbi:hypothetical protein REPUB_Repub16aG0060400 [Reevesia pubescens]
MAVSMVQEASTPIFRCSYHVFLSFRVFYDVDPTQVKRQTGSYEEAFCRHEERFQCKMNTVERWRDALKEVADLAGMVLQDRYTLPFIS